MADGTITVRALKATNSTAISIVVGAPISNTYTATMMGGVGVVTIPEADMVDASGVPVLINVSDGADTDSVSKIANFSDGAVELVNNGDYVPAAASELRVFVGARGFGTTTQAGRNGALVGVTNNNADGPGSLDAALRVVGARYIFVMVSGDIFGPTAGFVVSEGMCRLHGQTAPGDGFNMRAAQGGWPLSRVLSSDVLFQHVRLSCDGDATSNASRDSLQIGDPNENDPVNNVIIDHCTLRFGPDEVLEIASKAQNVTVCNSLVYFGLGRTPANGAGGGGTQQNNKLGQIAGGANNLSIHHNVFFGGYERVVLLQAVSNVDFWENLIAMPVGTKTNVQGFAPVANTDTPLEMRIIIENNLYLEWLTDAQRLYPSTSEIGILPPVTANGMKYQMLVTGNRLQLGTDPTAAFQDARVTNYSAGAWIDNPAPFVPDRPASIGADNLLSLLDRAGASAPIRDSLDALVIDTIRNRAYLEAPDAIDGFPSFAGNDFAAKSIAAPTYAGGPSRLGSEANSYVTDEWLAANNHPGGNPLNTDSNDDLIPDIEDFIADIAVQAIAAQSV